MGNSASEQEGRESFDSGFHTQESQDSDDENQQAPDPVVSSEDHQEGRGHYSRGRNRNAKSSRQRRKNAPTPASNKPRRSQRTPKKRRFLLNEKLVGKGKVIESRFDDRCGIDQPGRLFFRDDDEMKRREDEENGKEVFKYYLKPNGWRYVKSAKLDSAYAFLAEGETLKTAVDGETKFYSYEAIWQKWESDEVFREKYQDGDDTGGKKDIPQREKIFSPERIGRDYPVGSVSKIPSKSSKNFFHEDSDSDETDSGVENGRLGQPTPGVPAAAGLPSNAPSIPNQKPAATRQKKRIAAKSLMRSPRPSPDTRPVAAVKIPPTAAQNAKEFEQDQRDHDSNQMAMWNHVPKRSRKRSSSDEPPEQRSKKRGWRRKRPRNQLLSRPRPQPVPSSPVQVSEANNNDNHHPNDDSPLMTTPSVAAAAAASHRSWSTEQRNQLNKADFELAMRKKQLEIQKAELEIERNKLELAKLRKENETNHHN